MTQNTHKTQEKPDEERLKALVTQLSATIKELADEDVTIATLTGAIGRILAEQELNMPGKDLVRELVTSRTIIEKHTSLMAALDSEATIQMLGQLYIGLAEYIVEENFRGHPMTFALPHGDMMIIVSSQEKAMQLLIGHSGFERIETVNIGDDTSISKSATMH